MEAKIGERLSMLRKQHGFSQIDLAEKLGVSRQAISNWELGEAYPNSNNIICIAKLYNVSIDELLLGVQSNQLNPIVVEKKKDKKEKKIIEVEDVVVNYDIKEYFKNRSLKFYLFLIAMAFLIATAIIYWVAYTRIDILKDYYMVLIPLILLLSGIAIPVVLIFDKAAKYLASTTWCLTLIAFGLDTYYSYTYFSNLFYRGVTLETFAQMETEVILTFVFMFVTLIILFICSMLTTLRRKEKKHEK